MSRALPYPLLMFGLIVMWLLLTDFSLGQFVLGSGIAFLAVRSMAALEPERPRIRRWDLVPRLFGILLYDIFRSNLAVARLIASGGRSRTRRSGFVQIPTTLTDRTALAILAVMVTSTPGTAWMEYHAGRGILIIHVFDLVDEAHWIDLVKNRYEHLLLEIFQ